MNERLDPRLNPYRDDLAAEALRGRVEAPRFVAGERRQVIEACAPVRRLPRFDARLDTEALQGEVVRMFEVREGWAWAQLERDGYVGYLPAAALSADIQPPTHRVSALRTFVFPGADIKSPPLKPLSLNAGVSVAGEDGRLARLADGGFVAACHLTPIGKPAADTVAVAERFLGTPYLWGGRTSLGVDCSGLIQLAFEASGRAVPRDTDLQEAAIGAALPRRGDLSNLRRGDLVFWKGHVGMMLDGERLLHANAYHMETAVEPVSEAVARIAAAHGEPTSVRRP